MEEVIAMKVSLSDLAPNELRIDVEASTNAEAQFNAPPHQS
jgi:hypothetical protein